MAPVALLRLMIFSATLGLPTLMADVDTTSYGPASVVPVWPEGKMPGKGAAEPEKEATPGKGLRITNVSNPTLLVFPAPAGKEAAPAVVICPGGGYGLLAIDKEGFAVAKWLNTIGITGVVLKYRVPGNKAGALQDLERAMRLVQANAKAWNVDRARVGVMGFSAGGNLCARLLAGSDPTGTYPPLDATDQLNDRPDFVALIYPAYMGENGQVAPDVAIHGAIPPLFICQADDDVKYIPGTKIYDAALTAANVPHEFADYPTGGHGFGLGHGPTAVWPERFHAWLTKAGIVHQR